MSNKSIDLSFLVDFIDEILPSTERVKTILDKECNEARNVLRACTIVTTITKDIDEDCCTCNSKVSLENHAEEIVEGIGRALAQAQELREKIANNVLKQKRKAREPDVETIYTTKKNSTSKLAKNLTNRDKSAKCQESNCEESKNRTNKVTTVAPTSKEKCSGKMAGKKPHFKSKSAAEKKLLQISAGSALASSTTEVKRNKNFVAANKTNIKKLERNQKSVQNSISGFAKSVTKRSNDLSPLSGTSEASSSCAASIAELSDLMTKVSTESARKSNSNLTSNDLECPCHVPGDRKTIDLRVRSTIDLMEGLDRFGVPSFLVRPLKIYHSYIRIELMHDEIIDKRNQRAADKFLGEFHSMNDFRPPRRNTGDTKLVDLILDFSSLFRESFDRSGKLTDRSATEITRRYSELDNRGKICELQKFDPAKFRKTIKSAISKRKPVHSSWSSNGLWNCTNSTSFPNTTGMHRIRYASKDQLLFFFELSQRLQLSLYRAKLIDVSINDILPKILENLDHSGTDFSDAYKMIFTIAQAVNPRIPTLVRTDV